MDINLLRIDLSNRSYKIEKGPSELTAKYLGGRGLGAYLLYKYLPPQIDPLGEENHLLFTAGPASGTNLPFSSKVNLTTKSPLTGLYLYSISSGILAHEMKKAGFSAIDIKGISDSPVYIEIENQQIKFRDATSLWNMESNSAQKAMLAAFGKKAAAISIGPAGEKLIKYASIMTDGPLYRCFGRGGGGCVMGAKQLKGIIVSGGGKVDIGNEGDFQAIKTAIIEKTKVNKEWAQTWRRYGTRGGIVTNSELGILPTRNWEEGKFENAHRICFRTMEENLHWQNRTCGPFCPTPCSDHIEVQKGLYQGANCQGPEYEALYALGSNCGIDTLEAIIAAQQICDENGIDVISAGVSIGFGMECFEKGLLSEKDTGGIELRFGNDQAMILMLKKIVNREGFGYLLGEGVRRLSKKIKNSESFAMHVKGLELGGYECRGLNGQALQFAIDNRGGCHHGYGLPAKLEILNETQLKIEGKGELVKNLAIQRIISDCILVCTFPTMIFDNSTLASIISALLSEQWSVEDLKTVGMRVMCQERLFNMREGIGRDDDSLPSRLLNEPKPHEPSAGSIVPLEQLKDSYYRAMEWDLLTGNPTDLILKKLEIDK